MHGSLSLLVTPCYVDTTLGSCCKSILLSGYVWEDGRLCYTTDTLKSFGLMKMTEDNGAQYLLLYKLHWMAIPRTDLVVIGEVNGHIVTRCSERACLGVVSMVGQTLGGRTSITYNGMAVVR
ncbi:hypothetical protein PF008_g5896 [Phytophthora fragariae]|uniref:Uncharacterized protein n=1 Tax=Phytophthora fragariae TaxID=53985 RepID=A0A6G0S804_9STRA|nr:hypothetical protein PF008_g5896 [Phytophthora fragariae]